MTTTIPFCTNCQFCQKSGHLVINPQRKPSDSWLCTVNADSHDMVSGLAEGQDMIPCRFARAETGRCGPEGKLFKRA
jgi:hypothetical protein